jgi:hypothetical protein
MDQPAPALSLADEHAVLVEQVSTRANAVLLAVDESRWPDVELRRLVDHLRYELLDQAGQEERLLFPLVGGCAAPPVRPLLAQHAALRSLTERLGALAAEPGQDVDQLAGGVRRLRRLLERHVVEEERALATVTLDGVGARGRPPWCRGWSSALEGPVLDLDAFPEESAAEAVVRRVTRLGTGDSVEIRSSRGPQVVRRAPPPRLAGRPAVDTPGRGARRVADAGDAAARRVTAQPRLESSHRLGKNPRPWRHEHTMTCHHEGLPAHGTVLRDRWPVSDVEAWRLRRLLDAGFPAALAREVATTPGIDLHAVLALLDRGCPPELAVRILAPVEAADHRP